MYTYIQTDRQTDSKTDGQTDEWTVLRVTPVFIGSELPAASTVFLEETIDSAKSVFDDGEHMMTSLKRDTIS
jgi:hypothetical protein